MVDLANSGASPVSRDSVLICSETRGLLQSPQPLSIDSSRNILGYFLQLIAVAIMLLPSMPINPKAYSLTTSTSKHATALTLSLYAVMPS
ncbi:hypothetical protein GQ53DRAFT_187660 [Thozetella sp. PMI_491]|nr:hypothetical protein GQ53DRAFT_187660 [Thozetella sp. PMI_491]